MSRDSVVGKDGRRAAGRGAAPAAAFVLALVLGVGGCGRNSGQVPTAYSPEGMGGQDNILIVEVVEEVIDSVTTVPLVQAVVLDRTAAEGYRLYRNTGEGGFDQAVDYVTNFIGTYNQAYETYTAVDRDWQPTRFTHYLARATVQGRETVLSPLTNYAAVPDGDVADLLARSFRTVCPIDTVAMDSLPMMVWEPVAGAVRYAVTILRTDGRTFFLGLTPPDGSTHYQIGSGDGMVFQENPLTRSVFFWTVLAIDANSRIVGRSDRQIFVVDPDEARPPCTP